MFKIDVVGTEYINCDIVTGLIFASGNCFPRATLQLPRKQNRFLLRFQLPALSQKSTVLRFNQRHVSAGKTRSCGRKGLGEIPQLNSYKIYEKSLLLYYVESFFERVTIIVLLFTVHMLELNKLIYGGKMGGSK